MRVHPNINGALLGEAAALAGENVWVKFPNLADWISGQKHPSVNQLAEFAKTVRLPFGYFFLKSLPKQKSTLPLFRSGMEKAIFTYSADLQESIQTIERRQQWLVEYLKAEQAEPLPLVGAFSVGDSTLEIAANIRQVLQLPVNWAQTLPDKDAALRYLIEKVESIGIYVSINGVVGNNGRRNLDPHEFKGFVLSNAFAPYIFINGKDYPAAKNFTLMHELAHIWLGNSAAFDLEGFMPADNLVEKKCDAVAAELLVAENALRPMWDQYKHQPNPVMALERVFKVSRIVIARRLLDLNIFTKNDFFIFYNEYKKYWEQKAAESEQGGGSFYNNQNYRVGRAFFNTITEAARSGKLLYTDAYKLTGLYGKTFHTYETGGNFA